MASSRAAAAGAVLGALLAVAALAPPAAAVTNPDDLATITAFRDAMLARPGQQDWTKALRSWTCPTAANNTSPPGACDPCGSQVWGNWEHVACRGPRESYTKFRVPGTGAITNIHITDYEIEGAVPLAELCPLRSLTEFDVDGGRLQGPIPTGFAQCFPNLIEIDLSYNELSGTLPREIADVQTLEQFKARVEVNQLTGTIPAEYGSLGSLNWLRFGSNKFVGRLPDTFAGTAAHLNQLTLDENDFEGDLGVLAGHSFVNFNAAYNPRLCGPVPVGVRQAHSFNYASTRLGLPCPGEWTDLSEQL